MLHQLLWLVCTVQAILLARIGRNVDGLDLNLYQQALLIRRQHEAKLLSSRTRTRGAWSAAHVLRSWIPLFGRDAIAYVHEENWTAYDLWWDLTYLVSDCSLICFFFSCSPICKGLPCHVRICDCDYRICSVDILSFSYSAGGRWNLQQNARVLFINL
jgi:hypothetical protein